jgi:hypothetical protein
MAAVNDARAAETAGTAQAVDEVSAEVQGQETAAGSRSAELTGVPLGESFSQRGAQLTGIEPPPVGPPIVLKNAAATGLLRNRGQGKPLRQRGNIAHLKQKGSSIILKSGN